MCKMIPVIAIFAVLSLASASPYQYRIEPYQMAEDYQAQTESQESALKYQQQNFDGYHKQLTQPFQPQSAQAVQHQSGHAFQNPSVQQYQQLSAPEYQHESAQSFSYQPNQNYQYQPSESAAYKPQGFQNQPVQYSHQNYQQSQIQTAHSQTGGHEQNSQGNARILSYQQNSDEHNNYQYGYETENGIRAQETSDGTKTQGEYSYVGDDGQVYTVTYTADETGFHPSGAHLPTPPPIPDAIAKSIEKNLLDEANGIVDDGQYHELEQHTQQSEQMHQVVEPPVPYHQKMIVKKSANEQQRVQTPRPIQRDIHLKQHKHLEPHNVHLEKQDFHLKQQDLQDHQLQPQHVTQQPEKQLLVQKREPIIPFRQSHNLLLNIMNPEHNLMDHQGTDHHYYHNRFQQFAPMNELNSQTRLVQQIPQSKNVQLIHQLQNGFVPQHEYQVPLETSLIEKRPNIKEKYLMSHVLHHSRPIRLYHTPLFMKYSHPKEYLNPTAL